MATKKELIKAAQELNEVLGLKPAIDVAGSEEVLTKGITEAMTLIDPAQDEFSEPTQKVIDSFKEDEPELEETVLDQVNAAKKTSELLTIVNEADEFKAVRDEFNTIKNPIILKKKMKDLLTGGVPAEKPAKPEKPSTAGKADKPAKPAKAEKASKADKGEKLSRITVCAMVLRDKKPATLKEWMDETNTQYGDSNDSETKMQMVKVQKVAEVFGLEFPVK